MSVAHVELSLDEAVKELKAIKVHEQNIIAVLQGDRRGGPEVQGEREQSIANHRRRIDALHMAIEALEL
jgi:hypothetical protein